MIMYYITFSICDTSFYAEKTITTLAMYNPVDTVFEAIAIWKTFSEEERNKAVITFHSYNQKTHDATMEYLDEENFLSL